MNLGVILILTAILLIGQSAFAQKHEIAFTSGGLKVGERGFDLPQPGFLHFSTGFTYEINYAERLFDARLAALYFEIPLAGKLLPRGKYSPFATMGVGLSHFSESDTTIANQPNPNRSSGTNAVFAFGFGLDVKVFSILSIRGEVRDLYADLPPLNVRALSDRQHNALISAGVVLRF